MNILVATPVLYDKNSPFNHLFKDILEGFLSDGNSITRIVAIETDDDLGFTLGIDNTNIYYKKVKRKKSNKNNIIMRYIYDNLANINMAWKILRIKSIDVLFEDISYSSFWSVLAAKIKKVKIISMIQDVWPDNAVGSGILTNKSLLYWYFEIWQRLVYKLSDHLICISEDIKEFIIQKGIGKEKITVIFNWGYSDELVDIPWDKNKFVKKFNLDSNIFYAVYAGNIGKMQNVEVVVNIAQKLINNEKIHFLIIGDGVKKNDIAKIIQNEKITNVTMLPMQPSEFATSIYSMASVNLIPLVKGGVKTALPSKTGICLSCGQPILLCLDKSSEYAKMIEQSKSGVAVDFDDADGAVQVIEGMLNSRIKIEKQNVWACFNTNFLQSVNVTKYRKIVGSI